MSMACRICVIRSSGPGRRSPPGGGVGAGLAAPLGGRLRWGGAEAGGASLRPRWPCQPPEVADGLVRTCRTAATSGCWSSSTPGAPRRVGRGSGPPAPPAGRGQAPGQQHQAGRPVAPPPPGQGPRNRWLLADREEAAAGHQIADGQNPGGMMHQSPPAPSGSSATARAPDADAEPHPVPGAAGGQRHPAGRAGGDPSRWTSTPPGSSWPRRRPRPAGRPPRPAAAGRTAISTPRGWQLDR
jgi:hypothetical protein